MNLPTYQDVIDASGRLKGRAIETPLLESARMNERLGCRLLIKPECLQVTGSFKFRGAFNKLSKLSAEERAKGVVAYSSGNHAQGVACAAQILGIHATIVMPADAPRIKIANTKSYGADVVTYDRKDGNRVAIAEAIAAETGGAIVPPYNDPDIIAGQGTVGLELARQASEKDAHLDHVLAPCSGGGLISGCALAITETNPSANLYSVEPVGFDDTALSLEKGERVEIDVDRHSICDALLLETPGEITFALNKTLLSKGLVITDDQALAAMRVAFQEFKIVLEPSGAVALAAILNNAIPIKGDTVAVVCTGGNVDADTFRSSLLDT